MSQALEWWMALLAAGAVTFTARRAFAAAEKLAEIALINRLKRRVALVCIIAAGVRQPEAGKTECNGMAVSGGRGAGADKRIAGAYPLAQYPDQPRYRRRHA